MAKPLHSSISWISDAEWTDFLLWLYAEGFSQTQACEMLTEHANLTGGRGVVIKTLEHWLSIGGQGRSLADARRIILHKMGVAPLRIGKKGQ